ncbi:MAG: ABC transporter permease [Vicinamibacterales bacterium]
MTSKRAESGAASPLVELTLARLRLFLREPEAMFWTFVFPILMSVAMAVAFPSGGAMRVLVGIAPGQVASPLGRALASTSGLVVKEVAATDELRALREGEVHLMIVPGNPPTYRYDETRDESRLAKFVVDDVLKRLAGRVDPWTASEDRVRVAGSRYVDWLIPGLVGMTIMGTGMWGLGFSIVQARMQHLLKRLMASPMRKRDYLLAQLVARLAFLAPEVVVPLGFGILVLGVPFNGSVLALASVSIIGALAFGALGLLAASRARTIEAISGIMNVIMLPMWVLSGVFFSSANFPEVAQPFIRLLPLTALVDALRSVVLDGASLSMQASRLMILAGWTVVPFALAVKFFKWR